jgi:S-methylmethionine-dependent homocysteine/selenocysteine methylase
MAGPLTKLLAEGRPLILDGAMGTEIMRRGGDTGIPLWSAQPLVTRPDLVLQIHRDYIAAGADIITTDSFRTTRRTFRRAGLPDRSGELTSLAVRLAQEAHNAFPGREILLAGSIAPLEDCYRPDLVPSDDQLRDEHREHAQRLVDAGVDFLLLETMNTLREAVAATEAALRTGSEVVVSFICNRGGNLLSGESLADAVRTIAALYPTALSINCVSPRFMETAIARLRAATSLPFAVYGNVGLPEDPQGWEFTHDILAEEYGRYALEWLRSGASIVGGCCGTTPDYISHIHGLLTKEFLA